ncbi:MAG: hypothetical protein IJZ22_05975 [Bacteroidaceae bacterium]|nr:hypothetical protein [Bacteroidaceae bacterium]
MKKFTTLLTLLLIFATSSQAQANDYPFTLTQKGEAPVLYYIYSGRDGGGSKSDYVFCNLTPWNKSKQAVCLNRQDPRYPLYQFWYFMEAEDGNILIISAEDNKVITVANTQDAAKCTEMQSIEERTNQYYTWILDKTNGYYAFKTSNGATFLSHNGNWSSGGQEMGLYNANGSQDEGSRVFFEPAPAGVTTGITAIRPDINEPIQGIYTLTGQKIERITASGIYIINGKKTFVK